jgi:hypothetical protein
VQAKCRRLPAGVYDKFYRPIQDNSEDESKEMTPRERRRTLKLSEKYGLHSISRDEVSE